jgi:hypothetical protein
MLATLTELHSLLEKMTWRLDNLAVEKEMTEACLTDTPEDLAKEKKTWAALQEQVLDLSKWLQDHTARAVMVEGMSKQFRKVWFCSARDQHRVFS